MPALRCVELFLSSCSAEAARAAGAAVPGSVAQHSSAQAAGTLPQLWYDLAEAAAAAPAAPPRDDGWLTPIAQGLDWLLLWFQAQLNAAHVPYASGWAIVCLTLVTKTLTFPFTKIQVRVPSALKLLAPSCPIAPPSGCPLHSVSLCRWALGPTSRHSGCQALAWFAYTHNAQVESALATQNLKPTIDAIKRLYGDDKDKVQRETSALYKKSGVNPTAGAGGIPTPVCFDAPATHCGVALGNVCWGLR